jgi:ATP-dependent RNA circularization protein (DNA/RNA ligase family)
MTNSRRKEEKTMNFYENEALEQKMEELSDQLGYLVLDLLVVSLKKVVREGGIYSEIMDAKLDSDPF